MPAKRVWTLAIAGVLLLGAAACGSADSTPTPSVTVAPSPTPAPAANSLIATAIEDTFVKNTKADSNYGDRSKLEADNHPSLKRILVRFNVSGLPEGASVASATLRMFVVDGSKEAGAVHTLEGSWNEETTTWSNAPSVGDKVADLSSPAVIGSWVEADVTAAIVGNGSIDFYVVTSSDDGVDYISSEGGSNPPELMVRWSDPVSTPTPTTRPGASTHPVLVGAGDIASCEGTADEATAELLDAIPGTVFTSGDNVYDSGTAEEFANCYDPSWGRHKARTRPSVGNHEYLTEGALGYFGYFGPAAGDPSKGYYSYDLGEWHIVVINSNCSKVGGCSPGSPQEQWLRADLAAHPAACTLAYWHHPRFSSGHHGSDMRTRDIWQALYDYGADVALNGHDHIYERFTPQDPNGVADPEGGIRQFIVGTGGSNHTLVETPIANSEVRNDNTFGVLKLTLHPTSYDWEFVPIEGQEFTDSGSESCH